MRVLIKIVKTIKQLTKKMSDKAIVNLESRKTTDKELLEKERFYNSFYQKIIDDIIPLEIENPKNKILFEGYKTKYSALDPTGCVLFKDNGDIYRGIYAHKVEYTLELLRSGLLQTLAKHKMIPEIEITDYYTDKFPLILKIENLSVLSVATFSFDARKDIIINNILIDKIANHCGYRLLDGHLGNVTINKNRPVMFDIGSFIPKEEVCDFLQEIICLQILPIFLNMFIGSSHGYYVTSNNSLSLHMHLMIREFIKFHKKRSSKTYNKIVKEVFNNQNLQPEYIDILLKYPDTQSMWCDYGGMLENYDFSSPSGRFNRIVE